MIVGQSFDRGATAPQPQANSLAGGIARPGSRLSDHQGIREGRLILKKTSENDP